MNTHKTTATAVACTGRGSIGDLLGKALGVPPKCRKFTITCEVGRIVTVDAEFYPSGVSVETAADLLKRYELHEIDPEKPVSSVPL